MKDIILAGGVATRFYPLTIAISKWPFLLYDNLMIYYLLLILILVGIKDILIISMPENIPYFEHLLDDGNQYGITLTYEV